MHRLSQSLPEPPGCPLLPPCSVLLTCSPNSCPRSLGGLGSLGSVHQPCAASLLNEADLCRCGVPVPKQKVAAWLCVTERLTIRFAWTQEAHGGSRTPASARRLERRGDSLSIILGPASTPFLTGLPTWDPSQLFSQGSQRDPSRLQMGALPAETTQLTGCGFNHQQVTQSPRGDWPTYLTANQEPLAV